MPGIELTSDRCLAPDIHLEVEAFLVFDILAHLQRENLNPVDRVGRGVLDNAALETVAIVDEAIQVGLVVVVCKGGKWLLLHAMIAVLRIGHVHTDIGTWPQAVVVRLDNGVFLHHAVPGGRPILVQFHIACLARCHAGIAGIAGNIDSLPQIQARIRTIERNSAT